MVSILTGGREATGPAGHWERVADEIQGLALLRGVGIPRGALEWLDIRELLALRAILLNAHGSRTLQRRLTQIAAPPGVSRNRR
jgi:hypothetical protein